MCQHLSMARVAEGLGLSWNTANDAVLAEGQRVLINKCVSSSLSRPLKLSKVGHFSTVLGNFSGIAPMLAHALV